MSVVNSEEVERESIRFQLELLHSLDPSGPLNTLFHYTTAAGLHRAIIDQVAVFTAGAPQNDDVTLVVIEYGANS